MKKLFIKMVKPFIKRRIIKVIKNEEYRDLAINKLADKLPNLPGISDKEEKAYLLKIYDIAQEVAIEVTEETFNGKKK